MGLKCGIEFQKQRSQENLSINNSDFKGSFLGIYVFLCIKEWNFMFLLLTTNNRH